MQALETIDYFPLFPLVGCHPDRGGCRPLPLCALSTLANGISGSAASSSVCFDNRDTRAQFAPSISRSSAADYTGAKPDVRNAFAEDVNYCVTAGGTPLLPEDCRNSGKIIASPMTYYVLFLKAKKLKPMKLIGICPCLPAWGGHKEIRHGRRNESAQMHACLPYNLPTLLWLLRISLSTSTVSLAKGGLEAEKSPDASRSHTDIALVLDRLSHGKRKTFALLPPEIRAEVALLTTENAGRSFCRACRTITLARFLHFNNEDDAADLLHELPAERRSLILRHIKDEKRVKIENCSSSAPETAGGLMDLNFITVSEDETIKTVSDKVRAACRIISRRRL